MISDNQCEDTWTFFDAHGRSVRVLVILVEYPHQPGRSIFIRGVTDDGRQVTFDDGKYLCDDGTLLTLPCE